MQTVSLDLDFPYRAKETIDSGEKYEHWRNHVDDTLPGDEYQWLLDKLVAFAKTIGFSVKFEVPQVDYENWHGDPEKVGKMHGCCDIDELTYLLTGEFAGVIYLHPDNSVNNQTRTLAHELAHALGANRHNWGTDEVTAESVSYVVCKHFGFDTTNFALPYVASYYWLENGNIRPSDIEQYATTIIEGVQ